MMLPCVCVCVCSAYESRENYIAIAKEDMDLGRFYFLFHPLNHVRFTDRLSRLPSIAGEADTPHSGSTKS